MIDKANSILLHLREPNFDFDSCITDLQEDKKKYKSHNDENNANICWVIISIVEIHRNYLQMHDMLLNQQYMDAWCKAEEVEIAVKATLRVCPSVKQALELLMNNVYNLQNLYPFVLFASPEFVIKKRTCSICGKVRSIRNQCGHYVGYLYNGEMCYDTVEKFNLDGIAIVTKPENKYSVLLAQDSKPDYRAIEGLMRYWRQPYIKWNYTINTTYGFDEKGEKIPIHKEYLFVAG